jgi:hypothetical protein
MPAFIKPTATQIGEFSVRLAVSEDPQGGSPVVAITFAVVLLDAAGATVGRPAGDLRPELTPQQQAQLEALALALYTRAKTALLS